MLALNYVLTKIKHSVPGKITVLASCNLSDDEIQIILKNTKINGILLQDSKAHENNKNKKIGYFLNGKIIYKFKLQKNILFLGVPFRSWTKMLIHFWKAGVKKIWFDVDDFEFGKPISGLLASSIAWKLATPVPSLLCNNLVENKALYFFREKLFYSSRISQLLKLPSIKQKKVYSNKIMFVSGSLGPGGSEKQMVILLKALKKRNITVSLFVQNSLQYPNNFFEKELRAAKIPVSQIPIQPQIFLRSGKITGEYIKKIRQIGNFGQEIYNLYLLIKNEKPFAIHSWLDETNIKTGLAAYLAGVPKILLSCRSLNPGHFQFFQSYMKPGYSFLAKKTSAIFINNSKAGFFDYKKWLNEPNLNSKVIYNAVKIPNIKIKYKKQKRKKLEKKFCWSSKNLIISGIFRLSEEKRPFHWIDVAFEILKQDPLAKFLLVGNGPLYMRVCSYARQKMSSSLKILGEQQNIYEILASSNAFLLTSRMEGLPNVLLEAQSTGIPVFAPKVGGIAEAVDNGKTGILFESGEPKIIADQILKYLKNPTWLENTKKLGPKFVQQKFNTSRMVKAYLSAYKSDYAQ